VCSAICVCIYIIYRGNVCVARFNVTITLYICDRQDAVTKGISGVVLSMQTLSDKVAAIDPENWFYFSPTPYDSKFY